MWSYVFKQMHDVLNRLSFFFNSSMEESWLEWLFMSKSHGFVGTVILYVIDTCTCKWSLDITHYALWWLENTRISIRTKGSRTQRKLCKFRGECWCGEVQPDIRWDLCNHILHRIDFVHLPNPLIGFQVVKHFLYRCSLTFHVPVQSFMRLSSRSLGTEKKYI